MVNKRLKIKLENKFQRLNLQLTGIPESGNREQVRVNQINNRTKFSELKDPSPPGEWANRRPVSLNENSSSTKENHHEIYWNLWVKLRF